jgi:26S proteasome regulatory subunit N5
MAAEASALLQEGLDSLINDARASQDFSEEAEAALAKAASLVKAGRRDEALEELFSVEKKARMASDGKSGTKLVQYVITIFYEAKDMEKLNEHILMLAKKRSQLKRVIADMVQLAIGWIDSVPRADQFTLLKTLTTVTEGRIFVEVENARLSKKHAKMLEEDGKTAEAAELLQEVQVETCGAMERREKAEYILEQMRLVLAQENFVRLQIISRKINPKLLLAEDFQDIKLQYYEYMVKLQLHEDKYLDIAKSYYSVYNTQKVKENDELWRKSLELYVLFLLVAPYDNEAIDLLHKVAVAEKKPLEKLPWLQGLLDSFLTKEIVGWPLACEVQLRAHSVFGNDPHPGGAERWEKFKKRWAQHNLTVCAAYYTRIHMTRLAEMFQMTVDAVELEVSDFVSSKFLIARIDRPAGILTFGAKPTAEETLNDYSGDINKLLSLVEDSCHMIQKEQLVNAARAKVKAKK